MVKKELTLPVFTGSKESTAIVSLPTSIFAVKASDKLLSQYVYVYLNNLKKGFGKTKTRSEVTGSTRKIYRQKGTGRARHGDIKAPIFVGGGVALGPTGEMRELKLTKKMKRKALFYALSQKYAAKNIKVVADSLLTKVKKSKEAAEMLEKVITPKQEKSYFVLPHQDKTKLYFNNLDLATINEVASLNAYRVMKASEVVFTEKSLKEFVGLFIKETK